jgi:predicted O-methyltransferase YrrM
MNEDKYRELLAGLTKALETYHIPEGGSFQIKGQTARLRQLVEKRIPASIMEIGFNGGHSALLFLAITPPETKVVSFDLGEYAHVFAAKRYIDSVFPGRHTLVTGDSTQTVPNYEEQIAHRMNSKSPPPLTFDFIFIDGGHQGDIPSKDIINSFRLASNTNNMVVIDDISRDPSRQLWYTIEPTNAWTNMVNAGIIREEGYDDYFLTDRESCPDHCSARGMAWGTYNFDATSNASSSTSSTFNAPVPRENILKKLKYTQIQNSYKYMTRDQMVSEIHNLYHHHKDYEKLVALSDMYLEYFADYNQRDTNYIRFYRAGANFILDRPMAIKQYEEIIDTKVTPLVEPEYEMPEHIKFYSVCNLGTLYPKDPCSEIPKIIHLLFFGETEFYNFHHRCVHSMLQYMPNYEVRIYNSKEPVNNKYWDDIKNQPKVKIIKIDVPQHFDGFELKHFQYKADVVRLEVLYEHGGVYLDLDMIIIRPFDEVFNSGHSFYISKERAGHDCLINAFLASKPKNEFIKLWLNAFKSGLRLGIWAHHIRDSNKKLLDEHPHYEHKYRIKILEGNVFMPLHWQDTEAFLRSENTPYEFPAESYGTHLWETILGDVMRNNNFLNKQKNELTVYNSRSSQFCTLPVATVVSEPAVPVLVVSPDYFNAFRNDQFVNEYITKGKRDGYFLEIGACDGLENSSCYYFEKNLGWKGLSIEPARVYSDHLRKNRATPVFAAVSNVTSSISNGSGSGAVFYESNIHMLSGLKTALELNKDRQDWSHTQLTPYKVDTITLYDLCCQQYAPENIDYCAIGCEVSEYDILSTFFDENRVQCPATDTSTNSSVDAEVGLTVTNKVFRIDMFSVEVSNDEIYNKIRDLFETNNYVEIENPFLRILKHNGKEITWEKYFINKNMNSPQLSLSSCSSTSDVTPQPIQTPPASPETPVSHTVSSGVGSSAGFLLKPPFAEEVVAICLEERPERTKYVSDHLVSHGIKHTLLLNHIHPENTKIGCFRSHMKAIQYAKSKNLSSVLIMEDDIIIRDNISELTTIKLPTNDVHNAPDWDILYFGGILTKFDKMDATNKWVKGTIWCNHAYLVKKHMYQPILDFVESYPNLDELERKNIDYMYTEYIQPKYNCWLAYDQYIIQKEGYSEIDGRVKWTNQFDWSTFSMKVI